MASDRIYEYAEDLVKRYPQLETVREQIMAAYEVLERCYENGGKLLLAGNGGSASDCEHMAGELMKRFRIPRPLSKELSQRLAEIDPVRGAQLAQNLEMGLTAVPLVAHEALSTAYINDVDGYGVYAQQLLGFARPGDVFMGISTSGNSRNVMNAVILAKALELPVIGLTGADGGELGRAADVAIKVPETETYKIQELHLPVYHCLCMMLEEHFFGKL
jgi:D-sedoheptulose 7-phosphate isomerase